VAFNPRHFEADLAAMDVTCRREVFGEIQVYTDFLRKPNERGNKIAPNRIRITASANPAQADLLIDGNLLTSWQTPATQQEGMWVQLDLSEPATLKAVAISYALDCRGPARAIGIRGRTETLWQDLTGQAVPYALDRFEFRNGHPVYGRQTQTMDFPAVKTSGLRLIIREPDPACAWAISEIELYGR